MLSKEKRTNIRKEARMATSSITKQFKIKDESALKRYEDIMSGSAVKKSMTAIEKELKEGEKILRKFASR
jgi:hypothetical protein